VNIHPEDWNDWPDSFYPCCALFFPTCDICSTLPTLIQDWVKLAADEEEDRKTNLFINENWRERFNLVKGEPVIEVLLLYVLLLLRKKEEGGGKVLRSFGNFKSEQKMDWNNPFSLPWMILEFKKHIFVIFQVQQYNSFWKPVRIKILK